MAEEKSHAGVAFPPPFLLAGLLWVGYGLQKLMPLPLLPKRDPSIAGWIGIGLALGLFIWAVVSMRRGGGSLPTHTPTEHIVTRGPYGFSRNPIYLSMVLILMASMLVGNSLWFLILAILSVPLYVWGVISREERYLLQKFGDPYAAYCARVRRWL